MLVVRITRYYGTRLGEIIPRLDALDTPDPAGSLRDSAPAPTMRDAKGRRT